MNAALLRKQAMEIAGSGSYPRFRFRLIFTLPNRKLEVTRVIEKYTESDYVTSFTHDTEMNIAVITADYNLLYANRDNLNATLVQEQVDPVSSTLLTSGLRYTTAFRVILKDNSAAQLTSDSSVTNAPYTDGKDELRMLRIQLVDPIAVSMNTKYAQGIFRYAKPVEVLKSMIITQTNEDAAKGLPKLVSLDVVDPDNDKPTDVIQDLVIENNIRMVGLAAFLQDEINGIYNHGIGSFIQNQRWYVYPLFNTRRFKTTTRRLTIIQSSSLMIPASDRSFKKVGEEITVVCAGAVKMQDLSVSNSINGETAIHFTRASGFLDKPAINDNNQSVYNRQDISADIGAEPRADKRALAGVRGVTDNLAKVQSDLSGKRGMLMVTTWQRSDIRLLTPGMPVRVYYDNGGNVTLMEGVLIQANEQWTGEQPGLMSNTMKSAAALMLYLEKV
ncbi:putative virion structural protein [Serratia phage vB_SmaS-Totoro]|nr:putative virion structural protein [Serratia phage vB_SmaS-Totoro]